MAIPVRSIRRPVRVSGTPKNGPLAAGAKRPPEWNNRKRANRDRDEYNQGMSALFPDTDRKVEAIQIEIIRRLPAWKKIAMVDSLNETVKTLAISGLRERHPDATPQQIRRLLADMILGVDLAQKVYGHAK